MIGVTLGEKHSYDDWGLILSSCVITPPDPQLNLVTVPLRDGSLDLTEALTDDVKYKDRSITLTFTMVDPRKYWSAKVSEISNYLHGKRMKIIIDDDLAFYYVGRVAIDDWNSEKSVGKLVVKGTVDPYKYDIQSSAEDWLWDPFDFETGIVNEVSGIVVEESTSVTIIARRKRTYPTITVSEAMQVTYEGTTYDLAAGSNKVYSMLLQEGENELTFTGNGTVTVEYTGGSL